MGIPTLTAIDPQFQTPANDVGFAIPSNRVRLIAPQLIQMGKVTHTERAAMGVQLTSLDADLAAQNHLAVSSGVLVVGLTSGGPAQKAGLKPGDVNVQVGTHPVFDIASLADALLSLSLSPGEIVSVSLYRGSEYMTIKVTLGEAQAS